MNNHLIKRAALTTLVVGTLASLLSAHGQPYQPYYMPPANRWYVKVDAGGNLTQDTDLEEFFGEDTSGSNIEFEPGIRFGVAGGYQVTDWFAPEIETGIMANWIDSIEGANDVDASFSSIPLMANIRFQLPRSYSVSPYIGVGAGVSFAVLDSDFIDFGSTSMHGSDSDAVFAYQGFAGIRFRLNQQMGLSLEYRYFHSDEPEWDAEFTSGTGTDKMRFGKIETHSLSIAFDFNF